MSGVPERLASYRCGLCGAVREQDVAKEAPGCGELHSDLTRFPDSGWIRTEQWEPHGTMVLVGSRGGNPLQAQVDAAARVVRKRFARKGTVRVRAVAVEAWEVDGAVTGVALRDRCVPGGDGSL